MTLYRRREDIEAAPMLEETVLYSAAARRFCVLNATASLVWQRLAEPASADSLIQAVRENFEVGPEADVAADVGAALRKLEELQLITQVASQEV